MQYLTNDKNKFQNHRMLLNKPNNTLYEVGINQEFPNTILIEAVNISVLFVFSFIS